MNKGIKSFISSTARTTISMLDTRESQTKFIEQLTKNMSFNSINTIVQ